MDLTIVSLLFLSGLFFVICDTEKSSVDCCADLGLVKVMMHHFERRFKEIEDEMKSKDKVSKSHLKSRMQLIQK